MTTSFGGDWIVRSDIDDSIKARGFATYEDAASYCDGWDDVYPCRNSVVDGDPHIESQASFDARQAQGRAERLTRIPEQDPFKRLPVLDESPF